MLKKLLMQFSLHWTAGLEKSISIRLIDVTLEAYDGHHF